MMILFLIMELSRTSGFIDIPTVPEYNIPGMYGGGLMFSATLVTTDPDKLDDQNLDPMDFDLFFRYGFAGRGELAISMFHVHTYVASLSYLLAEEKENVPAFFAGIDDISYNTHISTIGMNPETGFLEEYNYAKRCGGRPWELFSAYVAMQKSFGQYFNAVLGFGRGRFVGYGERSRFFNTDLFVLGDDYKTKPHSWWAFAVFFGGSIRVPGGLELCADIDSRDGNIGMKYRHKYVTATIALAKAEHLPWWNKPPYSPRFVFGLETNNRSALEAPKVGSIECIVQDFTTKELLANSVVSIKEVNKRYKATTGIFTMSLPAGSYTITVSRPYYVDYLAKITVKPGVKTKLIFNLKKIEAVVKEEAGLANIALYLNAGKTHYAEGNLSLAKESFTKVLSLDPNNAEARTYLANIETRRAELITSYITEAKTSERAKDLTRALEYWTKVLDLDSAHVEAKTAIASLKKRIQVAKRPPPETRPPQQRRATKEQIEALYKKGLSFFTAQKYDEALKVFKQVLALDPNHKPAREYKKRTEARIKALKGG